MVLFNYSTKELTAKVVYYGPGLCGKTTNLQWIHDKLPIKNKGKMLSLATETDRTLFFDFLPIELGAIRGMKTRIQLYTVPGQVFYNATRRMVLKGADGVVFVADSQEAMLDANAESLENLRENLEVNEINLDTVPLVLQYNKRDLPNAASIEAMNARLNPRGVPYFESVALQGVGVEETLKGITGLVFKSLAKRYGGPEGAASAAGMEQPNPRRKSVTGSIPIVPTPLPTPKPAPVAAAPPSPPPADAFSPEDLLEIDEPPPVASGEPIEEFSLDELGVEPEAPGATITEPPLDLDSLEAPPAPEPIETLETVEEFSPLAELEGFLEEVPEAPTPSFGGATQPPEPDPLAELELEPDSPAAVAPAPAGFDPAELSLGDDEPAAPEPPPMRFDESAEISLDASELLEPPPPEPEPESEPALELDGLGTMEPQIDFGAGTSGADGFDPMALVGSDTAPAEPEPIEPPDSSGVGAPPFPDGLDAFDADPLAGLAGAAESPPVPPETPPVEAPPFDPWKSEVAEEPLLDLDPDGAFPEAVEMPPSYDDAPPSAPDVPRPEPASLESLGDPELPPVFEPPAPEPPPPEPEPELAETGFDFASLESLGDPEPIAAEPVAETPPELTPTSELPSLDSLGEPVPDAVPPTPSRAVGPHPGTVTAPVAAAPPEPEPEPEHPQPSPVPASVGVGVAATASSVPAAALATAVPTADVRTASLAVTPHGDNEITIPIEIALGPGGTTQLNLNIRLTLNFKMK
jgi:signal recognition particle receptor subunit beta